MTSLPTESALKKTIVCAIESSYATDATPTGLDGLVTEDWKVEPLVTEKVTRNIDRPGLGGTQDAIGAPHAKVTFKVPLAGSGDVGDLPNYSNILRASQFAATVVADTSVTYNLVSGDIESASLHYFRDERLRKLIGFRGSVGFAFKNGDIPKIIVEGSALYVTPQDGQTPPTLSFNNVQDPQTINYANTSVFTFGGTALALLNFDVSAPGNMKHRDAPNQKEVRVSKRRDYTGKLTVLQRLLSDFDPETLHLNADLSELVIKHGTGAGKYIQLTASKVQIMSVAEGEEDGDATWELDLMLTGGTDGDDDLVLTLT